jgi:hypothetical protein
MNRINKENMNTPIYKLMLVMLAMLTVTFTACSDDDDQSGAVLLEAFGPSPTPRGGQITFIGKNLDRITAVVFPTNVDVTGIEVINSERIKVTVPQTAGVGYIRLIGTGVELTTRTQITYTEPVGITRISPATVKPGGTLTIEGDYLNLITRVIFTGEKVVASDDFLVWERGRIELTVPLEAQSGVITLSNDATEPIELESETELTVVLPTVAEVAVLAGKKPGDEINVTVEDVDLVEAVELPGGEAVAFTVESNVLTFVLPEGVTDGVVCLVSYSGLRVPVVNLGMAVPTELAASPATAVKAGDVITITGKDMDLVTSVTFPHVEEAVEPDAQSATEIKVTVPAPAQSGDLTLHTASGKTASVAIATLKPAVTSYTPTTITAGNDITLNGTDLTLVATVTFGGGKSVEVEPATATSLTLTVPVTAETGSVVLTMKNGETVECPPLTVDKPVFCYIPELPGAGVEILSGKLLAVEVENSDKLTGVEVKGQSVQYILQGATLYLPIPQDANGNTDIKLISSNGTVTYTVYVTLSGIVETTVFEGPLEVTWGDGGRVFLPVSEFQHLSAGAILKIYFTQKDAWGQIQINNGAWTTIKFDELSNDGYITTDVLGDKSITEKELVLTTAILDNVKANADGSGNGFILQGSDFIVDKISIIVVN